jgi:SAM-dependent methyltransferase
VEGWLTRLKPSVVLDIGCNTGEYSRLAAVLGSKVVAVDTDHDAVELLYRQLRVAPATITPLVVDVANPSPGLGYMNREHASFRQRLRPDCVLALAVLHHLVVSSSLSLNAVRDLLWELTAGFLVLEVIPQTDVKFMQLMARRRPLWEDVTVESVTAVFGKRFACEATHPIAGTDRQLLLLRRV